MKNILCLSLIILLTHTSIELFPQQPKNKGNLRVYENEFYDEIKKASEDYFDKKEEKKKVFKVDFTGLDLPESIDKFTYYWHNDPLSQGNTGTCWSFSTTSFFESEIYRINKRKVKLSEIYTAYWEYVEKVRRFVRERGNSYVAEGSEANAVRRIWEEYGIVPAESYSSKMPGQKFHNHSKLIAEITKYLESVKERNAWNEEEVLATVKSILNYYLGTPPIKITY